MIASNHADRGPLGAQPMRSFARTRRTLATRSLVLRPVPPFRLDLTAWALRRRPVNGFDRWNGTAYSRTLEYGERLAHVTVVQTGSTERPAIRVTTACATLDGELQRDIVRTLDRTLGLSVDLAAFHALARDDARLGPLAARFRGLKPPRFPSVFEALINAIACQQFTLTNGIRLLNSLAARTTVSPQACKSEQPPFPSPARISRLPVASLRDKGFSRQKAISMTTLAKAVASGELDLELLAQLGDASASERLQALHGVGRWSAEYVLLRGLGRTSVFPGDDVGARNNLQRWLGVRTPLDYRRVQRIVAPWRPFGGLVYFHLLLAQLDAAGYLA